MRKDARMASACLLHWQAEKAALTSQSLVDSRLISLGATLPSVGVGSDGMRSFEVNHSAWRSSHKLYTDAWLQPWNSVMKSRRSRSSVELKVGGIALRLGVGALAGGVAAWDVAARLLVFCSRFRVPLPPG